MGTHEEQPSVSQQPQEQARANTTDKRKKLWILIVLSLALAVGLTLGLVLRNKVNKSQDSPASEQESIPSINPSMHDDDKGTATTPAPAPSRPWPYEESDIPQDPNLRLGRLANGLRYMILPHPWPEGQVSFRLHMDAGSLMEDDDQLGYGRCWSYDSTAAAGCDSLISDCLALFFCQTRPLHRTCKCHIRKQY